MEFIKHNQLLKIRVGYDQDSGYIDFEHFIESHGLERLSDWEWLKIAKPDSPHFTPDDLRDTLAPYTYSASGYSQGDYARLYLIGMEEEEAERLTKGFKQYAFDTPYRYSVELIDCETGETITDESLGGIYDDTSDLRYLKCELKATLNGMGEIHPELRDSALSAIAEIDYTDINQ